MSVFEPSRSFWTSRMLSVLRIVAGVVYGAAIVLGLFTRPVAFVLSGEMAVAYWQFHFPLSPFPTVNNGIPAVLYCFIYLYFAFAGGGAWSLDSLIARSRERTADSARNLGGPAAVPR